MNVSATTAAADASAPQSVVVAKKALDQQKVQGEQAVQLIQAASPPPLKSGQSLSVYA